MATMAQTARQFHALLYHPAKVFWLFVVIAVMGVLIDGSFIQLWSLHREMGHLQTRIAESQAHSRRIEYRIQQASQPEFIERQARDQLDLVREGDLVFVFSDSDANDAEAAL